MAASPLSQLQAKLGYHFTDLSLLEMALTHRSLRVDKTYERLEFLGDRVLGLVLADALYRAFPGEDQGGLSTRLHHLAQQNYLAAIAQQLQLASYIQAEKGNHLTDRASILSDVVEAVLAAVWLDGGWEAAEQLVLRFFDWQADPPLAALNNPKSALQEYADARALGPVKYEVTGRSGPEHALTFVISASLPDGQAASGSGGSKKAAESAAAQALLAILTGQENG